MYLSAARNSLARFKPSILTRPPRFQLHRLLSVSMITAKPPNISNLDKQIKSNTSKAANLTNSITSQVKSGTLRMPMKHEESANKIAQILFDALAGDVGKFSECVKIDKQRAYLNNLLGVYGSDNSGWVTAVWGYLKTVP